MSAAPTSSGPSALVKVGLAVAAVAAVGAGLAYAMWPGSKPVAKKTSRSNSPTQQHAAAKKKKKQAGQRTAGEAQAKRETRGKGAAQSMLAWTAPD
jgi:flagellar basal body-associated protein FliL